MSWLTWSVQCDNSKFTLKYLQNYIESSLLRKTVNITRFKLQGLVYDHQRMFYFTKNLYQGKPYDSPTVKIYLTKIDKHIRAYECG